MGLLSPSASLQSTTVSTTIGGDLTVDDDLVVTDDLTATDAFFKGSPWFDVKAYGALGDGTTDDATAIQAALTAVPSTGAAVFFPPGTYIIGTALSVKANSTLIGVGASSILKAKATLTSSIVANASSGGSITVSDLLLDGNSVASVKGIWWSNGTKFTVTRCRFQNFVDDSIRHTTLNYASVSQCQFTTAHSLVTVGSNYCVFENNQLTATVIQIGTGGQIGGTPSTRNVVANNVLDGGSGTDDHIYVDLNASDNIITNNVSRSSPRYGIIVDQSPRNLISGNIITSSSSYGILITNNTVDGESSRNQVIGNHIRSAGAEGILAQGASAGSRLTGVTISNNTVELCTVGIGGTYLQDSIISDNFIELTQQHGIFLQTCSYCHVEGNHIKDSSQQTNNTYRQIYLNPADHTLISGNSTRETAANKAIRGVEEAGTSDNNYVVDNKLSGFVTAAISLAGASSVQRNNFGATLANGSNTGITLEGRLDLANRATFTALDTTPSVSGGNIFATNNGSATTITNFDDSVDGQILIVMAADANTTVQHNANIDLQGAANFVMANKNTLTLFKDPGNNWVELSRKT